MSTRRARIALLIIVPLGVFYVLYISLDRIWSQSQPSDLAIKGEASEDLGRFRQLLAEALQPLPLETSDFEQKGDRVHLLYRLLDYVQTTEDVDLSRRLLQAFEIEYPWWLRHKDEYRPWTVPKALEETGIVICAGSKEILFVAQLIEILREVLESKLPIEIAFAGEADLSREHQAFLKKLGPNIETVNIQHHFDESFAGLENGKYAIKPFAVIASRFSHVLLLDADTVFMQNPDNLLTQHQSYKDTGLLFYHDRGYKTDNSRRDWITEQLHSHNLSTTLSSSLFWREDLWQEQESGVVGVDKTRPNAYMTLMFSAWMNAKDIREKITYQHFLGDKETYWLAGEFAQLPYAFVPGYAGIIGVKEGSVEDSPGGNGNKVCGTHIVHMDATGHYPMWFNGGIVNNKALAGDESHLLGTFKHYITSGKEMDDLPLWSYTGGEVWCAEASSIFDVEVPGHQGMIEAILQQGKDAERRLIKAEMI